MAAAESAAGGTRQDDVKARKTMQSLFNCFDRPDNATLGYDKARREADRLIRKHADTGNRLHACLRAYKALAYMRDAHRLYTSSVVSCEDSSDRVVVLKEDLLKAAQYDAESGRLVSAIVADDNVFASRIVLDAFRHYYHETYQPKELAQAYGKAVQSRRGDEDMLTSLFMAHVACLAYSQQQMVALQLAKAFDANDRHSSYAMWSIVSLFMRAQSERNVDSRAKLLQLAKTHFCKLRPVTYEAAACWRVADGDDLLLLVQILRESSAHAELADLLRSNVIANGALYDMMNMQRDDYFNILLEALVRSEQYDVALSEGAQLVQKAGPHVATVSFAVLKLYLWAAVEKIRAHPDTKTDVLESVTRSVLSAAACDDFGTMKTGSLLRLEWIRLLLQNDLIVPGDLGTYRLGEPSALIDAYLEEFGGRCACALDLAEYLPLLGDSQKVELIEALTARFVLGTSYETLQRAQPIQTVESAQRAHTALCLRALLGYDAQLGTADKRRLAKALVYRYSLSADDMRSKLDGAHVLLTHAVHLLWDVYRIYSHEAQTSSQSQSQANLSLCADACGERAVTPSSRADDVLLELAAVLHLNKAASGEFNDSTPVLGHAILVALGASDLSELQIKYMQSQTMGHLCFNAELCMGRVDAAGATWLRMRSAGMSYLRELAAGLVKAYEKHAYAIVAATSMQLHRAEQSIMLVGCAIMHSYAFVVCHADCLSDVQAAVNLFDLRSMELAGTSDLRDFGVVQTYEADAQRHKDEQRKASFAEMTDMLRHHWYVLRALDVLCTPLRPADIAVSQAAGQGTGCDVRIARDRTVYAELRALVGQMKAHGRHCADTHAAKKVPCIYGPMVSHWYTYWQGGYFELVDSLIDCIFLYLRFKLGMGVAPGAGPSDADGTGTSATVASDGCQSVQSAVESSPASGTDSANVAEAPPPPQTAAAGDAPHEAASSAATATGTVTVSSLCGSVDNLSVDSALGGTHISSSVSNGPSSQQNAAGSRSTARANDKAAAARDNADESPPRMAYPLTAAQLHDIVRRIISCHQLCARAGGKTPSSVDLGGPRRFPYLQLCHLTWLAQSVSVGLLLLMVLNQMTKDDLLSLGISSTGSQSGRGKKASRRKKAAGRQSAQSNRATSCTGAFASNMPDQDSVLAWSARCDELCAVLGRLPDEVDRLLEDVLVELRAADHGGTADCAADPYSLFCGAGIFKELSLSMESALVTARGRLAGSYEQSARHIRTLLEHQRRVVANLPQPPCHT